MKIITLVAIIVLSVSSSWAIVGEVTFQGSTQGAFNANPLAPTDTLFGLTYFQSSAFNGTTSNGYLALGGLGLNNFGTFTLLPPPAGSQLYNGNTFSLQVLFTAPPAVGGASTLFAADLIGSISSLPGGGVLLDFVDNGPRSYTFAGTPPFDVFELRLTDLSIFPNQVTPVNAFITVIPEVPTVLPLALIAGVAGFFEFRRRRAALTVS